MISAVCTCCGQRFRWFDWTDTTPKATKGFCCPRFTMRTPTMRELRDDTDRELTAFKNSEPLRPL